jgi:hypothetical protein
MKSILRFFLSPCLACSVIGCLSAASALKAQVYVQHSLNQAAMLTASAGSDLLVCEGQPANLGGNPSAVGGTGPYTYNWTPPTGLNNPNAANPVATLNTSTTFIVQVSDQLGCVAFDTLSVMVDTCVGVDPMLGVDAFEVFPNPNNGQFSVSVKLRNSFEQVDLQVMDVEGRPVYQKRIPQPARQITEQISLSGLSRGTYFIRLEADGQQLSRKMILR